MGSIRHLIIAFFSGFSITIAPESGARMEPRATNTLSLARVNHVTNFLLFTFGREERPTARAISHQALVPQCEEPHLHVKVV